MNKYRVTAIAELCVVTEIEANSEEEALRIARDRETSICIHGSEYEAGYVNKDEFTAIDGSVDLIRDFELEEL